MSFLTGPETRKSRGRPRENATPVNVRVRPQLLEALDKALADKGLMLGDTRPEAVRAILEDWLRIRGLLEYPPVDDGPVRR